MSPETQLALLTARIRPAEPDRICPDPAVAIRQAESPDCPGRAVYHRERAGLSYLFLNTTDLAASQMATTAGCLIRRSTVTA